MTSDVSENGYAPEGNIHSKLNWLRAGVLGANDGIVSIAAILSAAVAFRTTGEVTNFVLQAGLVGLIGGALSMSIGEYVSVSTQKDAELKMNENGDAYEVTNPFHAALASFLAFVIGGILPIIAVLVTASADSWVQMVALVLGSIGALAITGWISASITETSRRRAILRVITGGSLAIAISYGGGALVGVVV